MSVSDPYKVLQVDPEAELEVIEAAYRRLARKYHPDVSPDPDSTTKMIAINMAWEQLRDPVKRAAVDRARKRTTGGAAWVAATDARTRPSDAPVRPDPVPRPAPPGEAPSVSYASTGAYASTGSYASAAEAPPPPGPGTPLTFGSMTDPAYGTSASTGAAGPRAWATGRVPIGGFSSGASSRPDGAGAAGPPPGKPSGSVLNFGRYAGWSLGEIARFEPEYLEWLDRMPIGRVYQQEIDELLRAKGYRTRRGTTDEGRGGPFRRR